MILNNVIYVVNKKPGRSSFSVVNEIKKITGTKKVGHTGTLDPLAEGVLPICVGEATKLSSFLMSGEKSYTVTVKLGERTNTMDSEGQVTEYGSREINTVTENEIIDILKGFVGEIMQIPPMFSAIKHKGERLYDLARKGQEVERKARKIVISKVEFIKYTAPYVEFCIDCSKGTYVRSIADEFGKALGTFAHITKLVRTRVGYFTIEESIDISDFAIKENVSCYSIENVTKKIFDGFDIPLDLSKKIMHGYQLTLFDLKKYVNLLKDYPKSGYLAIYSDNKLVAITKLIVQGSDLLSVSNDKKILEIVRVFNL